MFLHTSENQWPWVGIEKNMFIHMDAFSYSLNITLGNYQLNLHPNGKNVSVSYSLLNQRRKLYFRTNFTADHEQKKCHRIIFTNIMMPLSQITRKFTYSVAHKAILFYKC